MADTFSFKITKEIGVLSTNPKGWSLELNMVSWNNRDPKYDIRSWSPDHQKMGKGVTLQNDDLSALKNLLNAMDL
ncbi:MAG TPA: YdbC family protein [Treponemataceae bacterium]|nr:YdbC family protein [Treponemataceae bacterium]